MADLSLTDNDKATVRTTLFHHLAGIVIIPTLKSLLDRRVFDLFGVSPEPVALDQIVNRTHGNRGYLRVALRLLVSCGWMVERAGRNGSNVVLLPDGQGADRHESCR